MEFSELGSPAQFRFNVFVLLIEYLAVQKTEEQQRKGRALCSVLATVFVCLTDDENLQ